MLLQLAIRKPDEHFSQSVLVVFPYLENEARSHFEDLKNEIINKEVYSKCSRVYPGGFVLEAAALYDNYSEHSVDYVEFELRSLH